MPILLEPTGDVTKLVVGRRHPPSTDEVAAGPGLVAVHSARSPSKETDNEDAAAVVQIDDQRVVLVVADGLGGHRDGAAAAALAIDALVTALAERPVDEEGGLRPAILDGFEIANRRVTGLGSGAATTLAAVEIVGDTARPYHVGDSMILVVGQRGKLKHQTVSHSPVGYLVEAGLLDPEEALHHEERHVVSNVVGSPDMRIDVGPTLKLGQRDTVVLATDGLFDNLRVDEIIGLARKGPLGRSSAAMADAARTRMTRPVEGEPSKPDDLTFVLYRGTPRR